MPLYEYQCKKCGHKFERIVRSYSSGEVKECPVCKGEVEQLLSAPAVQFKGSGFYSTDYAKPSSKPGQSSGDGAAKPAASGGETAPASATATSSSSEGGKPAKTETTSSKPAPAKSSKSTSD